MLKSLPERALTGQYIDKFVRNKLKIPYFRGVFMRDALPLHRWKNREVLVINLGASDTAGTHWVALERVGGKLSYYMDSYGLRPPHEVIQYCQGDRLLFNKKKFQKLNSKKEECVHCGHLTLFFICKLCQHQSNLQLVEMSHF